MLKDVTDLKARLEDMTGEEAKEALAALLARLEEGINCELDGSISMIRHPLSDKIDWYFTYDEAKIIPINAPAEMEDRAEARLVLILDR